MENKSVENHRNSKMNMKQDTKTALIIGAVLLALLSGMPLLWGGIPAGQGGGWGMMGPGMMGGMMGAPAGDPQNLTSVNGLTVAIKDFTFTPARIQVGTGATVTWTNEDSTAHTVTGTTGNEMASHLLVRGERFSYTFSVPGAYSYYCTPHPWMTGVVTVV